MLKRRGFTLMIVSLALAFGAAWLARGWVHSRLAPAKPVAEMSVVVAAAEIPYGIKVDSRYLRVIRLPRGAAIGAHFSKPDQVVGLVARQKVLPGEILLTAQFAKKAVGSTLSALLKPDMRAITVPVNDVVGVAGFLLPGNRVDVVEARMVDQRAVTRTVLRDLQVLAVDQTDSRNKNTPVLVRAVTLEVTPPQAEVLVKAMTEGKIQLTLRSPLAPNNTAPMVARTPPPPPPRKKVRRVRHHVTPVREDTITIVRGTDVSKVHAAT